MRHAILYEYPSGSQQLKLTYEERFKIEQDLHDVLTANPDLIPAEDLGLRPPLLVAAKEAGTQVGDADLLCLDAEGTLIIIEVKRDARGGTRRALAQALDYGCDIWRELNERRLQGEDPLEVFEERFRSYKETSGASGDSPPESLREAAARRWSHESPENADKWWADFADSLRSSLEKGIYCYIALAPEIPQSLINVANYLSSTTPLRFGAVEVRRFVVRMVKDDVDIDTAVFVSQAVAIPPDPRENESSGRVSFSTWLYKETTPDTRTFWSEFVNALNDRGMEPQFTSAGSFLITTDTVSGGEVRTIYLSDQRGATSLKLGGNWARAPATKQIIKKWLGELEKHGGSKQKASKGGTSQFVRWDISEDKPDAEALANQVKEVDARVRSLPEEDEASAP